MRAVAIDWRSLYYATETGLYRHRLPARPSAEPIDLVDGLPTE